MSLFPKGSWLRDYILWAEQQTDAPLAYALGTGLAVLAQAAPDDLKLNAGGRVLATIWSMCVGDSSDSRKSTAIYLGEEVLRSHPDLHERVGQKAGSTEGYIDVLAKHPKHLLVFSEYGEFLSKTTEGYLAPMRELLTDVYDGSPQTRTTRKIQVKTPPLRVSMVAGVTPEYLEEHTAHADWTGGFLARHVVFFARRERTYTRAQQRDVAATFVLGERLAAIATRYAAGPGRCLGFGPEAQRMWDEWNADVSERYPAQGIHRWARGMAARAPAVALKACLLLALDGYHVGQFGTDWEIPASLLPPAIEIAEMHLESGAEIVERLATTRYGRERRVVLESLRDGQPRTLGQIVTLSRFSKRDVGLLLDSMTTEGVIAPVRPPGSTDWLYRSTLVEQPVAPPAMVNVIPLRPKALPMDFTNGDPAGWSLDVSLADEE